MQSITPTISFYLSEFRKYQNVMEVNISAKRNNVKFATHLEPRIGMEIFCYYYIWCLFSEEFDGTSYESYADEDGEAAKFSVQLPKLVFCHMSLLIEIHNVIGIH